ncbi:MAG: RNA polymerase sigma factor [Candidatus Peribacteraceae bacterium]|nr:RNA polymerase sigma factor [Candidatus Peribacteraceae bacterium]
MTSTQASATYDSPDVTGESQDFTSLYDLHFDEVFRYCFWKCRDREIGMDLTQEAFLRFWICIQRKQDILHARAFLYKIVHNLFVDHVRRKKESSLDQLLETGFQPSTDPWHTTNNQLDAARPMQKLHAMDKPFKNVLQRRFILGQTPAQIAALTGETSNTVSVRIFRGLKHLRVLLKQEPLAANVCYF